METENESPQINFVPCLKWVKRGVAKANPERVQLSQDELREIIKKAKANIGNLEDSDEDENKQEVNKDGVEPKKEIDDEFNFASYDNETDGGDAVVNLGNIAVCVDDEDKSVKPSFTDDSDSEKEDDIIKPDDNLILVGHVEGDASILEVYVYNENEGSLYVHHDMLLPSFPLCIEWLNLDPSDPNPGNLCAVGTMSPVIEVWDLDIMDGLESAYVLGENLKKKKKQKKVKAGLRKGHTDAVLALAWNEYYHHVLASGSVDNTVLLWDIHMGKPSVDINIFEDKVQSLQWHPFEASTLLVGSCDKTSRVFDCRAATENINSSYKEWIHDGEIESVAWNSHEPYYYLTGTSEGQLSLIDCRTDDFVWSFKAHDKEITGLYVSKQCPGLVTTVSNDGKMSTWDLYNTDNKNEFNCKSNPTLVHQRDTNLGAVQCLGACPDNPFVVAIGGDKKTKNFHVYDLKNVTDIAARFNQRKLVQNAQNDSDMMDVTTDSMNKLLIKK